LSFTGNAKKNIIIVGATNHESALDSAVRRRFTQVIQVKAPDTQARIKILKIDIDYLGG
jgi:SpoVK/Ycf46/Vps4 family AAA+-type ATPase